MALGEDGGGVNDRFEVAELGAEAAFRLAFDEALGLEAVADEVGDGNHAYAVEPGEFGELGDARHGAIVVHDFADDAALAQAGETGEIDGGFGLAGANEHAA